MASHTRLKENWKAKGGPWNKVVPWMNLVARRLNNITGHGKVDVQVNDNGIEIVGYGGGSLNLSLFVGGIASTRTGVATMNVGLVKHNGVLYWVNSADVIVSGSSSIITIRYERGVGATYMSPAPSTRLQDDGTCVYIPLFTFEYGILTKIHRLGEVWL